MSGKILKLPLQKRQAQDILLQAAEHSERIIFTNHAEERMHQRGISRTDVIRVLKTGEITEGPGQTPNGDWNIKVEGMSAGDWVTVAIAIKFKDLNEDSCLTIIITTF